MPRAPGVDMAMEVDGSEVPSIVDVGKPDDARGGIRPPGWYGCTGRYAPVMRGRGAVEGMPARGIMPATPRLPYTPLPPADDICFAYADGMVALVEDRGMVGRYMCGPLRVPPGAYAAEIVDGVRTLELAYDGAGVAMLDVGALAAADGAEDIGDCTAAADPSETDTVVVVVAGTDDEPSTPSTAAAALPASPGTPVVADAAEAGSCMYGASSWGRLGGALGVLMFTPSARESLDGEPVAGRAPSRPCRSKPKTSKSSVSVPSGKELSNAGSTNPSFIIAASSERETNRPLMRNRPSASFCRHV